MKALIHIFVVILMSPMVAMGADERCEEILTISYDELDAARSENRSKRILGKISEESFLTYRELLDARQEQLEQLGPRPRGRATSQTRNFEKPHPKYGNLLPVRSFHVEADRTLEGMDYNPRIEVSILLVSSPKIGSTLFRAHKDEVEASPIELEEETGGIGRSVIWDASFSPNVDGRVVFRLFDEIKYWDMGTGNTSTALQHVGDPTDQMKVSNFGGWLYPKMRKEKASLAIYRVRPNEELVIQHALRRGMDNITMSPNEDFMMWTSDAGRQLYLAGIGNQNIKLNVDLGARGEARNIQMNEDSSLIYVFDSYGQMKYLPVGDLITLRNRPFELKGLYDKAESDEIVGSEGGIYNTKFSSDGRYFAFVERGWGHSIEKGGTYSSYKFNLWDNHTRQMVYSGDYPGFSDNKGVKFGFTVDKEHLYFHNEQKAMVLKILDREVETIL